MADEENSSSSRNEGSPLTRPGFLVAAAVVLVIVVLGVLLAVRVRVMGGHRDRWSGQLIR